MTLTYEDIMRRWHTGLIFWITINNIHYRAFIKSISIDEEDRLQCVRIYLKAKEPSDLLWHTVPYPFTEEELKQVVAKDQELLEILYNV